MQAVTGAPNLNMYECRAVTGNSPSTEKFVEHNCLLNITTCRCYILQLLNLNVVPKSGMFVRMRDFVESVKIKVTLKLYTWVYCK
jgi:hypothetical protein